MNNNNDNCNIRGWCARWAGTPWTMRGACSQVLPISPPLLAKGGRRQMGRRRSRRQRDVADCVEEWIDPIVNGCILMDGGSRLVLGALIGCDASLLR